MMLPLLLACPGSTPVDDSSDPSLSAEVCDGVDNNGDGLIDEMFPDSDGDGIADCLQCSLPESGGGTVVDAPDCSYEGEPAADPWDMALLWDFTPPSSSDPGDHGCRISAAADLNGDGGADILCHSGDILYAVSGVDGTVLWQLSSIEEASPSAVGDIDQDGDVEVAAITTEGSLWVLEGDGSPVFLRSEFSIDEDCDSNPCSAGVNFEFGDIDGDGEIEVYSHRRIVGPTGIIEQDMSTSWIDNGVVFFLGEDLDADGQRELLVHGTTYSGEGDVIASHRDLFDPSATYTIPLAIQADDDDGAEIFWVEDGSGMSSQMFLVDDDGTLLAEPELTDQRNFLTPSCAGDLNSDGIMEVFSFQVQGTSFAQDILVAMDVSGAEHWRFEAGEGEEFDLMCALFDFDLDGRPELLFHSTEAVYLLDTSDGSVLHTIERSQDSSNYMLSPLVVDVDGDGSVEIVLADEFLSEDASSGPGLRVYSHREGAWPPGTKVWGHRNWSGVGVFDNGEVSSSDPPPWLSTKLFRGQPSWKMQGADLRPVVTEGCASLSPHGEVRVSVVIENLGPQTALAGTPFTVYTIDEDGSPTLYDTLALTERLPPGQQSPAFEVLFPSRDALEQGVSVEVDAGFDCDASNNHHTWNP